MILPENSYLRKPPKKLNPEQVIIFNAIRYSVDICEISYNRLIKNLSELTEKKEIKHFDFPNIFMDVWSIINHSVVFKKIICKHFEIKENDPKLFEINKAKDIRDSGQHIYQRISELQSKQLPIYGYLTWTKTYPNTNEAKISCIYSGTFTNNGKVKMLLSNQPEKNQNTEIQKLEFTGIIREKNKKDHRIEKILINNIINDLSDLVCLFDKQAIEQLSNYSITHENDFIIKIEGEYV